MYLTRSSKNLIWFLTPPFTFSTVMCKLPLFCLYHVLTSNFCTCFSNVWVGGHYNFDSCLIVDKKTFVNLECVSKWNLMQNMCVFCCNNMTNLSRVAIGNYSIPNKRITHGQEFYSGMLLVVRIGCRGNIVVG